MATCRSAFSLWPKHRHHQSTKEDESTVPWPSSRNMSSRLSLSFSFLPLRRFLPPFPARKNTQADTLAQTIEAFTMLRPVSHQLTLVLRHFGAGLCSFTSRRGLSTLCNNLQRTSSKSLAKNFALSQLLCQHWPTKLNAFIIVLKLPTHPSGVANPDCAIKSLHFMRTTRKKVCAELTSTTKASWATIASAAREKLLECHLPKKKYNVDLRWIQPIRAAAWIGMACTSSRRLLSRNHYACGSVQKFTPSVARMLCTCTS